MSETLKAMQSADWIENCPASITVCDRDGTIVAMNEKAHQTFLKDGGRALIGRSLYDCHNEASNAIIRELLAEGKSNSYTIEKNGVKKFICQCPWWENGKVAGLVEWSIEIPFEMPHFIRT
jgi:nitrogen-specific signal transduction histidine kinase